MFVFARGSVVANSAVEDMQHAAVVHPDATAPIGCAIVAYDTVVESQHCAVTHEDTATFGEVEGAVTSTVADGQVIDDDDRAVREGEDAEGVVAFHSHAWGRSREVVYR